MLEGARFAGIARRAGFRFYTGVPCSHLGPLLDHVALAPDLRFVPAANEGDAVAIASGAALGGTPAIALFQNSGLGNAVNPLTSLNLVSRIPVLLLVSWRGEPGGAPDEPQHEVMGAITPRLLDLMGIPWTILPEAPDAIEGAVAAAARHLEHARTPYALVVRGSGGQPASTQTIPVRRPLPALEPPDWPAARQPRAAYLAAVRARTSARDILVATTGHTGRELYAAGDAPGQLYCVGAMGCASSLALGLSLARPDRRVVVLDGDGAALMRLGALATIGFLAPPNLHHVLLDNERHDSTGGQPTVSASIDLGAIARACGYPRVVRAHSADALGEVLAAPQTALSFTHVKVAPGVTGRLPRPRETPAAIAERLRTFLEQT